jgi:hypothetical protein
MFATIPCYNEAAGNTSENRIINLDNIEEIKPHADANVEGSLLTCTEARFKSGATSIFLMDLPTLQERLKAITGAVDDYGQPILS